MEMMGLYARRHKGGTKGSFLRERNGQSLKLKKRQN